MINQELWKNLSGASEKQGGLFALRLLPNSGLNIYAAVNRANGNRILLLKFKNDAIYRGEALPSGRGFNVHFVLGPDDTEGRASLQFELTDAAFADVFDVICNDVLRGLEDIKDEAPAFTSFVLKITEWQNFLGKLALTGLTNEEQQGLFAELWFLKNILIPELGPVMAVEAWAGPNGMAKDFQLDRMAFEVKSTAGHGEQGLIINGVTQLDPLGLDNFFVYALLLERQIAGGVTLPEVIDSVRGMISQEPEAVDKFAQLLIKSGFTGPDSIRNLLHFEVRSQHFYRVDEQFPRIIESDLRSGVFDVTYSILMSECERSAVPEEEIRKLLKNIKI